MSDMKETIISSIKAIILPEIGKLQEGIREVSIRLESMEKQIVIINENVLGNKRQIEAINKRIDDLNCRIDETNKSINQRLDDTNKRIDDVSQRIDETGKSINQRLDETSRSFNQRLDETSRSLNQRLDETGRSLNQRIDLIYVELGNIKKEMERLKREDAVTADILHRMEVLEGRVLLNQ